MTPHEAVWFLSQYVARSASKCLIHSRRFATVTLLSSSSVEMNAHSGCILLSHNTYDITAIGVQTSHNMNRSRLLFAPRPSELYVGVTIQIFRCCISSQGIPRRLTTFRVHPDSALIFGYFVVRNVDAVREVLPSGGILPNDRDQDGNSLLWVSFLRSVLV